MKLLFRRNEVHAHDIERGDVLKDNRDGSMWAVLVAGPHDLRIRMLASDTMKAITYFGLVNFTRVGRKYARFQRRPDLAI